MPDGIRKIYEEAAADPELMNLQGDLAILETFKREQLKRLGTAEAGVIWKDLKKAYKKLQQAHEEKDGAAVAIQFSIIGKLIEDGWAFEEQRKEIADTIKKKTDLARAEWQRMHDLQQFLTAEQALVFATTLVNMALKHIPATENKRAFAMEWREFAEARKLNRKVIQSEAAPAIIPAPGKGEGDVAESGSQAGGPDRGGPGGLDQSPAGELPGLPGDNGSGPSE
jgi:hypothetical protein